MGAQQRLCAYVSELCGISSHGGRVHAVGDDTCVLSDVPTWTEVSCFLKIIGKTKSYVN